MKFVITTVAALDPRGITCAKCGKLMSVIDTAADTLTPSFEELLATGAVAVPHFGWFCGQECADAYSREHDIAFQRDSSGKVAYY